MADQWQGTRIPVIRRVPWRPGCCLTCYEVLQLHKRWTLTKPTTTHSNVICSYCSYLAVTETIQEMMNSSQLFVAQRGCDKSKVLNDVSSTKVWANHQGLGSVFRCFQIFFFVLPTNLEMIQIWLQFFNWAQPRVAIQVPCIMRSLYRCPKHPSQQSATMCLGVLGPLDVSHFAKFFSQARILIQGQIWGCNASEALGWHVSNRTDFPFPSRMICCLECLRSHQRRVQMILAATCMLRTSLNIDLLYFDPKADDSMIQIFQFWPQEIVGFFVAPFTGKYYFYLAADDEVTFNGKELGGWYHSFMIDSQLREVSCS